MKTTRLVTIGLLGQLLTGSAAPAGLIMDPTFTPGVGPDGPVRAIAVHRGDRILIGGSFQHYQGAARPGLARLLPDGSLDLTFDPTDALAGKVEELVAIPDDGVLVAGRFSLPGQTNSGVGLARLNWDGSRDPAFAPPLEWRSEVLVSQRTPRIRFGMAPDRSVVLDARPFRVAGREVDTLVRLRPDGSWDESFRPDISLRDWDVRRVAVAPDGSVWVAGHLGRAYCSPVRFGLVHFLADGTWDRRSSPEGLPRAVEDIALLPGGQVVGYGTEQGISPVRVFRLLPDGTPDPAFQVADLTGQPGAMALSPDGRVFLGPWVESVTGIRRNGVALLDPTGRLVVNADLSQVPGRGNFAGFWAAAAFDRQGRVLFSGNFGSLNGEPCPLLVRLKEEFSGQPDPTVYWGADRYTVSEGAGAVTLLCVRQGPVSSQSNTTIHYATVPESAQHGSDFTGQSGLVVFGAGEQVRTVQIPILEDDLEESWETFRVVLNPGFEGPPAEAALMGAQVYIVDNDPSYHISRLGDPEVTVSESSRVARIPLYIATMAKSASDGPLVPPDELLEVVYEERGARAGRDYLPLVRPLFQNVDTVDNLDPVGVYAHFLLPILDNAHWDGPRQLRLHFRSPSPRVVFAPSMASVVINITDNDTAAGAGRFIQGGPNRLAPSRGGRWLIAGNFDAVDALPRPGLARLEPDGAVEETFAPTWGPDGPIQVLLEGPDGEVIVAGQFRRLGPHARSSMARYRPDGGFDESFVPPDTWDTPAAPVNYLDGAWQSDGRLVLAGMGRFHGPGWTPGVVRLLPDGRADPDFHLVDLGFSVLTAFAVPPDLRPLVAGHHALTRAVWLRRLQADGQPDPDFALSSPAPIRALRVAVDGSIWVGTEAGLVRLPPGLRAPPGTALAEVGQLVHPNSILALVNQPAGRILAAWRDNRAWVSRFLPDGTPDPEFYRFEVSPSFQTGIIGGYSVWPAALAATDTGLIGTLQTYDTSLHSLLFHRYTPEGRKISDLRIERLVRLPSGEVHGRLRGQGGFLAVQRSTKLTRDWVDVYTITRFPARPPFGFVDTNAVRYPYAFYRLR